MLIRYIEFFFPNYLKLFPEIIETSVQKNLKNIFESILKPTNHTVQSYVFQNNFFFKQIIFKSEIVINKNFYICLINDMFCFLQKNKNSLLVFNKKIALCSEILLDNLCKINEKGQKSINLIFAKNKINLKFFDKKTKIYFVNDLLTKEDDISDNLEDRMNIKHLYQKIISQDINFLYDLINLTEIKMRKNKLFFKKIVYDFIKSTNFYSFFSKEKSMLLRKNINNELFEINYLLFTQFLFFINQPNILAKFFKIHFYSYSKKLIFLKLNEFKVKKI